MSESTERNKQLVLRLYDEVLNQENKAAIDEIFAADVVLHDPFGGQMTGVDSFKGLLAMFDAAFPHHRATVQAVLADGDYVSVLHTHSGAHGGEFMGLPATGREVCISGVEVMRMQADRIVEFWRHDDDAGLLMQLGILPAPGA
jgi:steroid delta-isomerase-like uncharacterized protein